MKVALRIDYTKYLVVHPSQAANFMAVLASATFYEGNYSNDEMVVSDKVPELKMVHDNNLLDAPRHMEVTEES